MFWGGFYLDPYGIIFLLPALIFAMYAQFKVQSTFHKYLQVPSKSGLTGAQVARRILDDAGLYDVAVELTPGHLTDHYDPRRRVMRLSRDVYYGTSLASLGVAAHETGHALQHKENYIPLTVRNQLFPVASIGSTMAFPLFFLGLIFGVPGISDTLMNLGIWLFAAAVAFQVVTLPVEFNASSRAVKMLVARGYIDKDEVSRTRAVLNAAALTYVAAAAVAALQLLRLILLRNARRD
ncbi:MAG TPA: zinc metallopeptidase [Limnochordia bacterium]|nr:zinc metallopeptidase [Limnochordia bacterium]